MHGDPRSLIGTRVGACRVARWVGSGDLATVFEADLEGRRVALKIAGTTPEAARRFAEAEARVRDFDHPTVARVFATGTDAAGGWVAMELLEGETLDERLRREGRLTLEEVLRTAEAILDALATVHARGIVHGSVKPSHVFATIDGGIKLLDFGASTLREHDPDDPRAATLASAFWAPEQARARWSEVDARTDVWAVGATMFALLTGAPPHDDADSTSRLSRAMADAPPSLGSVRPDLPLHVVQSVDRAMAYRPRDRFPNAAEMRRAVWRSYERSEGAPMSSPRAAPPPPPDEPSPASTPPVDAPANARRLPSRLAVVIAVVVIATAAAAAALALGGAAPVNEGAVER